MWESAAVLLVQGGPLGLITLGVVSILRGWLIPRSVHEARVRDLTQRAEDFRAAWQAEQHVSAERQEQISILLGAKRETGL